MLKISCQCIRNKIAVKNYLNNSKEKCTEYFYACSIYISIILDIPPVFS